MADRFGGVMAGAAEWIDDVFRVGATFG